MSSGPTLLTDEQRSNGIAVMGHVIADFPSASSCRSLIDVMVKAGVEIIEIQIPFSEPMADGALFAHANQVALEQGVTVAASFKLMREVTKKYSIPFLFMTYTNIVFKMGFSEFIRAAKNAGAKGAIIPDLALDHSAEYIELCRREQFALVQVIPPNVSDERLKDLCESASGLVYAAARFGVTGTKTKFGDELKDFLARIRRATDLPIAVGFGVKSRADVKFLAGKADVAVVGSRGLEVFQEGGLKAAKKFWESICGV